MQAVKPSDPLTGVSTAVTPPIPAISPDPAQTVKLLELELARKRAVRLSREGQGRSRTLPALSILFLLVLLGAGFYAMWRVQALQEERQSRPSSRPASQPR